MKKSLNWLWCFPQNLIGFVLYVICKAKGRQLFKYKDANVAVWNICSGASFGNFIFIPLWVMLDTEPDKENYIKHEYGHTLQSRKLGWLYLLMIMAPSMIWNALFEGYRQRKGIDYYSFVTEKWANELGGVPTNTKKE